MSLFETACGVCVYIRNFSIILGEVVIFFLAGYGLYGLVKFFL